jgi:hypothetical protein
LRLIPRPVLNQAKAFLSWDAINNCSIQLVKLDQETAYFVPPGDQNTILVFYHSEPDFSAPLFLLFHEAGHCLQYEAYKETSREGDYQSQLNLPTGPERVAFEQEAWKRGRDLFKKFLLKEGGEFSILAQFDQFAARSLQSYSSF